MLGNQIGHRIRLLPVGIVTALVLFLFSASVFARPLAQGADSQCQSKQRTGRFVSGTQWQQLGKSNRGDHPLEWRRPDNFLDSNGRVVFDAIHHSQQCVAGRLHDYRV